MIWRLLGLALLFFSRSIAAANGSSQFAPGEIWKDTEGNPINAHGGGVLLHEGVYYWYGESKCGRTFLPDSNKSWGGTRVNVTGVSCYSSTNLYEWRNEGLALTAVTNDVQHDLHPSKVIERPKVIYNRMTKKFVMWMHVDSASYSLARAGVAVSDRPTGPFNYLGSFRPNAGFWPVNRGENDKRGNSANLPERDFKNGQMARDLTLFVDDDQKAYVFYSSEENATMHVSALTDDYLRTSSNYARIFVRRSMEAPAVFKRDGKYYLIASGCTAWAPNAARLAVADSVFGPWKETGNPCVGKDAEVTFDSQSTFVLPNPYRKGEFIFMADRWNQWDLPNSRYVWLPLQFDSGEKPVLRWCGRWALTDVMQPLQVQRADAGGQSEGSNGTGSH